MLTASAEVVRPAQGLERRFIKLPALIFLLRRAVARLVLYSCLRGLVAGTGGVVSSHSVDGMKEWVRELPRRCRRVRGWAKMGLPARVSSPFISCRAPFELNSA